MSGPPPPDYPLPASPPPPGPARNVSYPVIEESRLENGLTVLAVRDARLPRFSLRLGLALGRQDNPPQNLALASVAVEMLAEGTETRDTRRLAEETDRWAIQFNSEVTLEYASLSMLVLEQHLNPALDLLADMTLRSQFPAEELEKVKTRWHSSLVAQRAQPWFLAREAAFHSHFAGHPYSRVEVPVADLARVEREQLAAFYRAHASPERCCLLLAGPITPEQALDSARRWFGEWEARRTPRPEPASVPPWSGRRVRLVHRPHSVQSRVQVSGPAPARPDEEALLFRLANQVFGGSGSSRIFLNLREEKGYTYGAYSSLRNYQLAGLFLAAADVRGGTTAASLRELLSEMERMRGEPPSDEELERARGEMIGGFVRRMETAASVGALEIQRRMTGLPEDYYSSYIPRLRTFTPEQVLESAGRWLDPENCLITVVGDREAVETELEEFGPVEVTDARGGSPA